MLFSLINDVKERIMDELSKDHGESINHFRNAEIEFLKGVRSFINEEIQCIDRWLEKQSESCNK